MGFVKDKSVGGIGESMVRNLFNKYGVPTQKPEGKFVDWDLLAQLPTIDVTLEVKFDLYCARSGNIAIEFFNPKQGKDSGLTATKADIWVHVINCPDSVWFTSVKKLKEYVASVPAHKVITSGGDDNSSMYLYRKDTIFNDIFYRVDECNEKDFFIIVNNLLKG